ncbi:MAG TPA: alpha/beta hydrolase [Acidobacteriaceae bacterium]|jgi:acetyl esterase/lipase|nr:alpha/beta hydrolase [Acidobacteriaceae bacterium]
MRLRVLMVGLACFGLSGVLVAQTTAYAWPPGPGHAQMQLWPHGVPNPESQPSAEGPNPMPAPHSGPEHDTTTPQMPLIAGQRVIRLGNVTEPTITLYKAPAAKNTHAAVVVFPGGGYSILAIDLEGTEVCQWLNRIGVNCVLLKYRVPASGPYPKSEAALQDAQRAMGMVREHAAAWAIDPNKVGVLGFSAGGHLAAALSTHDEKRLYPHVDAADDESCRPDFAIIIYPGYLAVAEKGMAFNANIPVTAQTPPAFLVQAEDDPVHVENAIEYFMALKKAGVPAELHVYTRGGHGYGLRPTNLPITHWPALAATWLKTIGMVGQETGSPQ